VVPLFPPVQGIKGVHYFDRHFDKGENWYRSFFPLHGERRRRIAGEASPYYFYHPFAARRAARVAPDARLILLLRDPVQRTLSHFRDERKLGHETRPLRKALEDEDDLLAPEYDRMRADESYYSFVQEHFSYAEQGRYALHVARWLEEFPREQLLVIRSEDLFEEPLPILTRVLEHIGVPGTPRGWFRHENASPVALTPDPETVELLRQHIGPAEDGLSELLGGRMDW
jgi:hypothetical protein